MKVVGESLINSTNAKSFCIHSAYIAFCAGTLSILGVGKQRVACGIWQQFTPQINTPTLTFSKPGSEENVPFLSEALRENVHDYHLSKKWRKKEGGKRNTAELTPRNSPFYSAQLNFINHRKSEMEKTY